VPADQCAGHGYPNGEYWIDAGAGGEDMLVVVVWRSKLVSGGRVWTLPKQYVVMHHLGALVG